MSRQTGWGVHHQHACDRHRDARLEMFCLEVGGRLQWWEGVSLTVVSTHLSQDKNTQRGQISGKKNLRVKMKHQKEDSEIYLGHPSFQLYLHHHQLVFQPFPLNSLLNAPRLNGEPSHIDRPNKVKQFRHQLDRGLSRTDFNSDQLFVKWVELEVKILGELQKVAP